MGKQKVIAPGAHLVGLSTLLFSRERHIQYGLGHLIPLLAPRRYGQPLQRVRRCVAITRYIPYVQPGRAGQISAEVYLPATSSAQANNSVPGGRLAHIHAGIKAAGGGHAVADAHLPGLAHIAIVIAFINDAAAARRFKERPRPRNTVSQSAESGYKGTETISRPDQTRPSPAELSSAEHADTANATTATDALSTLSI